MALFDRLRDLLRRLSRPSPAPAPPPPPLPSPPAPPPAPPPPAPAGGPAAELVATHNRERARLGLAPLRADARLAQAAQAHAVRMAALSQLAHVLDGAGPDARITAAGYSFSALAENVADGQRTAEEVLAGWLASTQGHRENALGAYADAGFGVADSAAGVRFWCGVYASPR